MVVPNHHTLRVNRYIYTILAIFFIIVGNPISAQPPEQGRLESVARQIMEEVRYAGLSTIDSLGYPNTRTMDALPPTDEFEIWLATSPNSRKVRQIRDNPAVSLYYPQSDKGNYVALIGEAHLVDDPAVKEEKWRDEWANFYPSKEDMLLIRVVPVSLEVVSYEHDVISQFKDWRAPQFRIQKKN